MLIRVLPVAAWVKKFYPGCPKDHWVGVENVDGKAMVFAHPDGNKIPHAPPGKVYLCPLPEDQAWCWISRITMTTAKYEGNQPPESIGIECGAYIGDPDAIREIVDLQYSIEYELSIAVDRLKDLLSK